MEGLLKQIVKAPPKISDAVVLGEGLKTCISSKFPGGADAPVWGPHVEKHCSKVHYMKLLASEFWDPRNMT